jgi:hypothetical protein
MCVTLFPPKSYVLTEIKIALGSTVRQVCSVYKKLRPCLGTKFLKTTVFEILQYTLVMTIPQFTIPQF